MPDNKTVYYLPGHGGLIATGLGEALASRGFSVAGRETVGEFRAQRFPDQLEIIAQDLRDHFWREDAHVVCVSYGAYLFLHTQTLLPPFPGHVLLLSPIVGEFSNDDPFRSFVPPRARRLCELAEAREYPAPKYCEVHVGSEDWQSVPENVQTFGKWTGIQVHLVPGRGHDLGKEYVGPLLDQWLSNNSMI